MKKVRKKIWSCLMTLAMAVTMLSGISVTANAATTYGLWVGGEQVTSDNLSGKGWKYNPNTSTLTLDGYQYTGEGYVVSGSSGAICATTALNIIVKGNNVITNTSTSKSPYWSSGIYAANGLTIDGDGSLKATGGTGFTSHGISVVNGDLTINSGTITATGQDANGSSGIYAKQSVQGEGTVTVNGGTITAIAGKATYAYGSSYGIECRTFVMQGGKVTAKADTVENGKSYGIYASYDWEFNAGTLNLRGETWAYKAGNTGYNLKSYQVSKRKSLTSNDFIFSAPSSTDAIYDGKAKTATVTPKKGISCGDVAVKYYKVEEDGIEIAVAGQPKDIGTYKVKIDTAENDTYASVENLTDDTWTFEIAYGDAIEGTMYGVSGMNAEGWAKGMITVSAYYRYQIGKDTSDFATFIQYDDETDNGNAIFFIRERSSGKIYLGSLAYKIDKTVPEITGIETGKVYCEYASFKVADMALKSVTDGENQITAQEDGGYVISDPGNHEITATDYAGNSTTVMMTVKSVHKYEKITYSWKEDFSECTASTVCKNCQKRIEESAVISSEVTQQQTCTDTEITTYKATFNNVIFETQQKSWQTKESLGHKAGADDGDCTTPVTCTRCQKILKQGKVQHDFGGDLKSDESGHWKACQNEGCKQIDKKSHTPNIAAATETENKVCTECDFIIEPKLGHIHKLHLESVKAKAATCTEDGNKAYYRCTEDQHCFLDENAENPVEFSERIIPATGHEDSDVVYIWSEDNSCTATIKCKKCQSIVKQETAESVSEITQKQSCTKPEITTYTATFNNEVFAQQKKEVQTKEATGHKSSDWIVDKEATVAAEGSKHKECTVCKTILETEVIEKLPMVSYDIIKGANGTYTVNSGGGYTLRANGEFSKFVSVEVDGKIVDAQYYTVKSGSTSVTFTKEYMNSLSAGKHVTKVNFTDGAAETTFVIAKDPQKNPQKTPQKDTKTTTNTDTKVTANKGIAANTNVSKVPQTGDSNHMMIWVILLAVSGVVLVVVNRLRRTRR